jgi:uncharacterized small protein (DUF1192 family)
MNPTIKRLQNIIDRDSMRLMYWPNDERVPAWQARIERCKAELQALGV